MHAAPRSRGLVFATVLTLLSAIHASPALSAGSEVTASVASKLAAGSDLSRLFAETGVRLPVIVQFAAPSLAAPSAFSSPAEADAAQTRAIRAVQDRILGTTFGSALAGPAADALAVKRMDFSPMFGIQVTSAELAALAANPDVVVIHEDKLAKPYLDESVPLIGMADAFAAGATGNGWHAAVLDTGGARTHEFLNSRIVSAACYNSINTTFNSTSQCPGGVTESTDINSANDCNPTTIAGCGHGTHVAGTVAGFNTNRQAGEPANGVARDGRLISINVFSLFTGNICGGAGLSCVRAFNSDQIKGLERVFALRNTLNIASVNMSLGGGQFAAACDGEVQKPIIDQLRAAGIATVIAAGNDGFDTEVGAPGCISTAVTVASTDKQNVRSGFSNWGNLIDLVAPGTSIFASVPNSNTAYGFKSGTSMATPHVAGAFAAIRSARPNATVDQIETALKNTGVPITAAGVTKPRILVSEALAAIPNVATPTTILAAVTPVARATSIGGTVTAFATILNTGNAAANTCSIAMPAGQPVTFSYSGRNPGTGAPENPGQPVNIPAGGQYDFLMSFTPTAALQANLALVFDCANSPPAPSVAGLNTFLLTGTAGAPADLVSIAVTATNDGIANIPLGGTGFAALAAINIGAGANLQARLQTNAIGAANNPLPLTLSMCQTNPQGGCISPQGATVNFTAGANQTVTFSAFATSNGTPIAFDPAGKRMFVHFFQGNTPVGSASVAVRTTANDASLASAN